MECRVKLTSFKLIPFGNQKQKFLPQCNILLPSPQGCAGTGSCVWEERGNGHGQFQSLAAGRDLSCYLLFIIYWSPPHSVE